MSCVGIRHRHSSYMYQGSIGRLNMTRPPHGDTPGPRKPSFILGCGNDNTFQPATPVDGFSTKQMWQLRHILIAPNSTSEKRNQLHIMEFAMASAIFFHQTILIGEQGKFCRKNNLYQRLVNCDARWQTIMRPRGSLRPSQ